MNLSQIVPIYLPAILPGCSKYIQDISTILVKKGHRVTILTANAITGRGWVDPLFGKYSSIKEERIDGVRVRRLKAKWQITSCMHLLKRLAGEFLPGTTRDIVSLLSAGPYLSNLQNELKGEQSEVIHVTAFPFTLCWQVCNACQLLKRPFVCTPLIHFEDPLHQNPRLWRVLKEASAVFACSNYEREGMIAKGVPSSKIHLVPMGINVEDWGRQNGERFREKYGLAGRKLILFAGTKAYNKGALHVLEAMEKIREKKEDTTLVSLGLSTDEWRKRSKLLGRPSLLDLGYLSEEEKKDAFDACDLFVMPSRYDSFGIVYLEAWQCAKPVIGARVGAVPEVIDDGENGLLVPFGDSAQLASAILRLLDSPDLCRRMGEKGKRKVAERYTWGHNIGKIEEVFERVKAEWR